MIFSRFEEKDAEDSFRTGYNSNHHCPQIEIELDWAGTELYMDLSGDYYGGTGVAIL